MPLGGFADLLAQGVEALVGHRLRQRKDHPAAICGFAPRRLSELRRQPR
jgi:hypothetical protein